MSQQKFFPFCRRFVDPQGNIKMKPAKVFEEIGRKSAFQRVEKGYQKIFSGSLGSQIHGLKIKLSGFNQGEQFVQIHGRKLLQGDSVKLCKCAGQLQEMKQKCS